MLEAQYRAADRRSAPSRSRGYRHPRHRDPARSAGAADRPERGHPRLYRRQRPLPARPRAGASPARCRYATDRTFLRRYDICRDDRLRSMVDAERIDRRQLHLDRRLGHPGPARRPTCQASCRSPCRRSTPAGGSPIRCSAARSSCRPTASPSSAPKARTRQRAFASARWDLRSITALGQELTLTAFARGDVYHSDENALTADVIYRGEAGWQRPRHRRARGRRALAVGRPRSSAAPSC